MNAAVKVGRALASWRAWVRLGWYLAALPLFIAHLIVCAVALPLRRLCIGRMTAQGIGHLALNTELFFRRRWLDPSRRGRTRDVVLISNAPANEQLFVMWRRHTHVLRAPRLHRLIDTTLPLWKTSPFFDPLEMWSNEYPEYRAAPPTLSFTPEEMAEGRRGLAAMGIDFDRDWFVCIFARDARYMRAVLPGHDWSYHDFRNADIDTFQLGVAEIVARGGFALRMGSHAEKPLAFTSERVIDYANRCRTDFMDVFLAAHCRLFFGSMAGIEAVATIFDRPRLAVNTAPFGHAPWGKHSLFIPKLVYSETTGTPYPFGRVLADFADRFDPKLWNGNIAAQQGYRYRDNTPEEILDVTREMLDRLEGRYQPTEDDLELQRRYSALVPQHHWSGAVKTPVGARFLAQHQSLLVP